VARKPVICVTPVKNEGWILEQFLACASLWADHIVVADQGSTDDSALIARRFSKVRLIGNESGAYDEGSRQRILIAAAREISPRAIVFALDADEFLSANVLASAAWNSVLCSSPGTSFLLKTFNVAPDASRGWYSDGWGTMGFHDDGTEHRGTTIHSVRVPVSPGGSQMMLGEAVLLHCQYIDWDRMRSKHRWYQCWETLHDPRLSPVTIYRKYHHMDAVPAAGMLPMKAEWLRAYRQAGIDVTSVRRQQTYWWDAEVLGWMGTHATARLRKIDIWGKDWGAHAAVAGGEDRGTRADPRSRLDRTALAYLRFTQRWSGTLAVRAVDKALKAVW
jgi:hypothetical protein